MMLIGCQATQVRKEKVASWITENFDPKPEKLYRAYETGLVTEIELHQLQTKSSLAVLWKKYRDDRDETLMVICGTEAFSYDELDNVSFVMTHQELQGKRALDTYLTELRRKRRVYVLAQRAKVEKARAHYIRGEYSKAQTLLDDISAKYSILMKYFGEGLADRVLGGEKEMGAVYKLKTKVGKRMYNKDLVDNIFANSVKNDLKNIRKLVKSGDYRRAKDQVATSLATVDTVKSFQFYYWDSFQGLVTELRYFYRQLERF